ncbi:thiamine phosphate synthase [Aquibium oceanicum]|uniref:Thiamine phosphate synthase n=2 Tax=Aquibium oceanicum TaxID=1670800 RepID=A0A1L3SXZ2_9HYPH|nr:thiamine phosphate synthase [Aquibium oceanicum]APH74258.1 thiamine phosphate synthase [Aquibium oceanicum]
MDPMQPIIPNRCRLVLIAPQEDDASVLEASLRAALSGGDVASLILPQYGLDDAAFQKLAERIVPLGQEAGAAVMIAGDTRVAARVKADGVHVEGGRAALADAIDRLQDKMMVGTGGAKTRDDALELGELRPDYLFFGRFGYDTDPQPHPRNLTLGRWWAEMIEVPCIVMGSSEIGSVREVSDTGAEFVALSRAVFGEGVDPAAAVAEANRLLDEAAQAPGKET